MSARRFYFTFVLMIALGMAFTTWIAGCERDAASARVDRSVCIQIELLKRGFRDSLARGLKQVRQIAYYRNHPHERDLAVAEIARQERLYAPRKC